jgi:hypothetical protein
MFDHGDLHEFIRDEEQMREDRHVIMAQPMENFDRQIDLNTARHEQECSRRDQRFV